MFAWSRGECSDQSAAVQPTRRSRGSGK